MGRLRHRAAIGCTYFVTTKAGWVAWDTWASLLTAWPVVAAATAGEVANAEQLDLVLNLDVPGAVYAFSVSASSARLFPIFSGHTPILSQRNKGGWPGRSSKDEFGCPTSRFCVRGF